MAGQWDSEEPETPAGFPPWRYLDTYERFCAAYEPVARSLDAAQKGRILWDAASFLEPAERAAVMNRLLDDGAPADVVGPAGNTVLHCLLGAARHDFKAEAVLLQRLIDAGADPGARNARGRSALGEMLYGRPPPEEELIPIYDVWFGWIAQDPAQRLTGQAWSADKRPEFRRRWDECAAGRDGSVPSQADGKVSS